MARRRGGEDRITIRWVKPTYAKEEDRIAAEARANAALKKLVELLAKAAARDAIREAYARADAAREGWGMQWDIEAAMADFQSVARLAGIELPGSAIAIEQLPAPHIPPTRLPAGKMAVYVFSRGADVLKVGKVGPNSNARYTSQHYNAGSAQSTFAASVLADRDRLGLGDLEPELAGRWIRQNIDRVNLLIDTRVGIPVLSLLESFLQCRLKPWYEGFKSQRV